MCVPIKGRVGVDAVAMMVSASDPHRYGADDVLLARDLAGRVAVALEHGRLLAEALEAIQARDTFLSVAAHELRTPLTLSAAPDRAVEDALQGGRSEPAAALRSLNATAIQARRLSLLVDSLLDVARLSAGRMTIHPEESDLAAVVRETITTMAPDAERASCAVHLATPGIVMGCWDRAPRRTGAAEPPVERPEIRRQTPHRGDRRGDRRGRSHLRSGSRHRPVARRPVENLRAIRARGVDPTLRRPRARPLHQRPDPPRSRRFAQRPKRARTGRPLHRRPPANRGTRRGGRLGRGAGVRPSVVRRACARAKAVD